jgi:hypothetical protein
MKGLPADDEGRRKSQLSPCMLGLLRLDIVVSWSTAAQAYDHVCIVEISPVSQDFDILPSTGYWIYANTNETLSLVGTPPSGTQTRSVALPSTGGWVNFGPVTLNMTWKASQVPPMFSDGSVTTVAWYNPSTGTYNVCLAWIPSSDFTLIPGLTYWCYCSGNATITYTS